MSLRSRRRRVKPQIADGMRSGASADDSDGPPVIFDSAAGASLLPLKDSSILGRVSIFLITQI